MATRTGGRRTREGDDDFAGLRAHRSADSPRHVAWKALARGGPMLTKEFAAGQGRELLLDWERLPPELDDERRLSRLTAWVLAAEREGRRYALALPGVRVPARWAAPIATAACACWHSMDSPMATEDSA